MTQERSTSDPMRFGVIGVGVIGKAHAKRLSSGAANTTLVALADAVPEAATAVAAEYDTTALTPDELLARDDIDAVVIAVPSGLHADITVQALDAGKHVLLEKPIDVTVDAADRIIEAEKRSGTVLTIMSQRRFAPHNQYLQHAINSGGFGQVTAATVEVALWRTQEYYDSGEWRGTWALDGGGALMNQGVHLVDMALWLLGDIEEVYAHTGLLAHERIEVEDTVTITARSKAGALITFIATTAAQGQAPIRMAIFGTEASAVSESELITGFWSTGLEAPEPVAEAVDQPLAQLNDFITAIQKGSTPLVTSTQARAAVAFIEAVYESGRTGKPVKPR